MKHANSVCSEIEAHGPPAALGMTADGSGPKALAERVRADSLQLFLAQWRGVLMALAIITATVFVVGREYAPTADWSLWFAVVGINTIAQASVCVAMERSPTPQAAVSRWLRWLIASIGINAAVWGLLPVMVANVSSTAPVLMALLNALLLFCVASSPGTHGMQWIATAAGATANTGALLYTGLYHVAAGYVLMVAAIGFYGWRLRSALDQGMIVRYEAEALALELRVNQERLVALERERTLLLERQRLTKDMHDGLGSTLVASLASVERGVVKADTIAEMLRDCLDDLRTVIDSLDAVERDLSVLLATLRFRLEPRLERAGVQLCWEMEDLPALTWLGAPEALNLMRIVQETLANVVKHSGATQLHISVRQRGNDVEVRLSDDGSGFDLHATQPGRGLRSLRERSEALGGRLEIETAPQQGTSVVLRIPVMRANSADSS